MLALVHQFFSSLDALLVGLPNSFVALCGNSSLQWYVADLACILRGAPTVSVCVCVCVCVCAVCDGWVYVYQCLWMGRWVCMGMLCME